MQIDINKGDELMKFRLNKTVAAVSSSALLLMAVPAVGIASVSYTHLTLPTILRV